MLALRSAFFFFEGAGLTASTSRNRFAANRLTAGSFFGFFLVLSGRAARLRQR